MNDSNDIRAHDPRGQTLHDFAIGMAVFLLVLGYVFAFVPSLFAPFTPETDSTAIRVDRTADTLTRDVLVENDSELGVLNVTCTTYFFNGSQPNGCARLSTPVDQTYAHELTGLPPSTTINVTMVRTGSIATYQGTGDTLAFGPTVEGLGDRVIRAVRIVMFDGKDYQFVVRIW